MQISKVLFLSFFSLFHLFSIAQVQEDVYVAIYKSSNESEAKTIASQTVKPSKIIRWFISNEWIVGTGPFSNINEAQIYANEINETYKKNTGNQFPYAILRFKKNTNSTDLNSNNLLPDESKTSSSSLPQTYTYTNNRFINNLARCNVEVKVPGISEFDVLYQDNNLKFTFTVPPDQGGKNLKITFAGRLKFLANIQPCNFKGEFYLNEIISNEWKNERGIFIKNSSWANRYNNVEVNVNYCLNVGFNHLGLKFSEDPPYDSSFLYPRPSEDKSKKIFHACNSIIDKQQYVENNVPCIINDKGNNIKTVCDKSLYTDTIGIKKVDFKQAVIALLNNEEVKIGAWETKQAEEKRLAQLEQEKKALAAAEVQRLWRESPEGKKYLAEEESKRKKAEDEKRIENERRRNEEESKTAKVRQQCEKMKSWASDSRELIASALKTSVSSVSLIRFQMGQWRCLAVVDTPRGPEKCVVMNILQDKKSGEYFADMGGPFAVQAACGGLAF